MGSNGEFSADHVNDRLSVFGGGELQLIYPDHAQFVLIVRDLSWASQRSLLLRPGARARS